jgi:flavin reductase (DIM6/NTAB) family NADH-FMN oxidoreductase RutF
VTAFELDNVVVGFDIGNLRFEAPASLECTEWGTLQIGDNRLIIGLVKRVQVCDELIDPASLRIRSDQFHVIGRMASPHWYCRTRDRFEMIRPA